jgi:hypothetical protein
VNTTNDLSVKDGESNIKNGIMLKWDKACQNLGSHLQCFTSKLHHKHQQKIYKIVLNTKDLENEKTF